MEASSNFPLTSLPNEVLSVVFSNLSWKDKLNACLVCKSWLDIINYRPLLRDIIVCVKEDQAIHIFMTMTRNFVNFAFLNITFDENCCHFLKRFAHYIEFIFISVREVNNLYPQDEVLFNNLKELELNLPGDWWYLFSAMPNLIKLTVNSPSIISDYGLSILQRSMKNLKILKLCPNVEYDPQVYMKFYPEGLTYETNPSKEIFSFPAIKSFLSARASTLCKLRMYRISASALNELARIKDLNLYRLQLLYFKDKCGDSLINLFKTQRNMKQLYISHSDLDDNTIDALFTFLPDIEYLYLLHCVLSDQSFMTLTKLKRLKKMNIQGGKGSTPEGRYQAYCNVSPTLKKSLVYRKPSDNGERSHVYFTV